MVIILFSLILLIVIDIVDCAPKRGLGLAHKDCNDVTQLDVSWWYDWHWNYPCSTNISNNWIPMIFNASDVQYARHLKGTYFDAVLGFNEPDAKNQANMTVNEALQLWPQLMDIGLSLCSPAPTRGGAFSWLKEFMNGVKQNNYRVDYLCFHWYVHPNDSPGMEPFITFLKNVTSTYPQYYGKIWLTEFANNSNSTSGNIDFFNNVYNIITDGEFKGMIDRFSWFTNRWGEKPDYGWDLINAQGTPTKLGNDYKSKPK